MTAGLSRAALQTLRDEICQWAEECVLRPRITVKTPMEALERVVERLDALLTAPSSPEPAQCPHGQNCSCAIMTRHEAWECFYEERIAKQALEARLQALTGYVQHKDGCEAWPQFTSHFQQATKHGACNCGLASLLTPAPPGEPEKLK